MRYPAPHRVFAGIAIAALATLSLAAADAASADPGDSR